MTPELTTEEMKEEGTLETAAEKTLLPSGST